MARDNAEICRPEDTARSTAAKGRHTQQTRSDARPFQYLGPRNSSTVLVLSRFGRKDLPRRYRQGNPYAFRGLPAVAVRRALWFQFVKPLAILMGIVALVLLLACANLSGLLLARGAARQAHWFNRALVTMMANGDELALKLSPDWRIFAFTGAVSLLACIFAGLAPGLSAGRASVNPTLKEVRSSGHRRVGRVLVVAQLAISMTLLVGASLFIRTLVKLYSPAACSSSVWSGRLRVTSIVRARRIALRRGALLTARSGTKSEENKNKQQRVGLSRQCYFCRNQRRVTRELFIVLSQKGTLCGQQCPRKGRRIISTSKSLATLVSGVGQWTRFKCRWKSGSLRHPGAVRRLAQVGLPRNSQWRVSESPLRMRVWLTALGRPSRNNPTSERSVLRATACRHGLAGRRRPMVRKMPGRGVAGHRDTFFRGPRVWTGDEIQFSTLSGDFRQFSHSSLASSGTETLIHNTMGTGWITGRETSTLPTAVSTVLVRSSR